MDFWAAYSELRKLCPRAEEISMTVGVSVWTVRAWDYRATEPENVNGRNPSWFNRKRLADLAEERGATKRVVAGLRPDPRDEARP